MSGRSQAARAVTAQGNYAGSVSRFAAYVIDLVVSTGLYSLALAAISYAVKIVSGQEVSWHRGDIGVTIVYVLWEFFYFGYSWAMSGRTFGMAILGIKVVQADGQLIRPRQGVVRSLVFPLSFLLFGLGFLGILIGRHHRALHDVIAGTAVVYAWDARAARLRFLAREAERPVAVPQPGQAATDALPSAPGGATDGQPSAPGGAVDGQPSATGDAVAGRAG
jgi:uncharacterized RDD family membrane protein YckC